MLQKLFLITVSLLLIIFRGLVEGLSVYPSISYLKLKPGESKNGQFTVINDTDTPVIVTTEIQDWIPTNYKGDRRLTEHIATYTNSIYDFIILEPENILVKARGEETIRYTISLPEEGTVSGGYWGLVCFSTKPPAGAEGMVLVTRLVSIMLVEAETTTTTKKMSIEKLYTSYGTEGLNLKLQLKNTGNTFIYPGPKLIYKIYATDSELLTEGVFGGTRLMLPEEEMEFTTEKPVELEKDREYEVVVAVDYGAEKMIGTKFMLNTASFFPWREEEIKKR